MQKVLIASPNVEQRIKLCQSLANDKKLEVIETADGKTALEKYLDIKPKDIIKNDFIKAFSCFDKYIMYDKLKPTITNRTEETNTIKAFDGIINL